MESKGNLKKCLTLTDTIGISVGQIIGAGIMSLTGYAILLTGKGAPFAFVLSAFLSLISCLPLAVLGSVIPTTGGMYAWTSRLISPKVGFFFLIFYELTNIALAMYALSFADYFTKLFPSSHLRLIAFVMIGVFFLINLVGVKYAARAENFLVVVKVIALLTLVIWGMPKVDFTGYTLETILPHGTLNFLACLGVVSFATMGANFIVELGGEMKNPHRDIPITIIATTLIIGLFYGLIVTVATGILPIDQVAGKSLEPVALAVLPHKLYLFFIVGGPLFALSSAMNATFAYTTKGMIIACEDGWLPKKLGAVNKKFGTPHWLLLAFLLVGTIPLVFGLSLETIANLTTGTFLMVSVLPLIAAFNLPTKFPEQYKKAPFKLPPTLLKVVVAFSVTVQLYLGYLIYKDLPFKIFLISLSIFAVVAIYVVVIDKMKNISGKMVGNIFGENGESA